MSNDLIKAYSVIKRPILTEKTLLQKNLYNKLTFEVDPKANKIEIRKAVELIFKVDVVDVHTIRMKGKKKRIGRYFTKRPDWKKAIVTIKPGQKVELFEGV
ncbi:MAG: 50S ribosomal protein L23 [Thermodesulforhabdaceae bacterium]